MASVAEASARTTPLNWLAIAPLPPQSARRDGSFRLAPPPSPRWLRNTWPFYTQNDWKVTRKLVINLGLRYEVQPGPTERHNEIGGLDLSATNPYTAQGITASNLSPNAGLGYFVFAGQPGYSRNLWNTQWNNFAPRVGAAYQLTGSTVLRGGYGRIYTPSNTGYNASTTIYGTSGFAGGVADIPYGLVPNGLPVRHQAADLTDVAKASRHWAVCKLRVSMAGSGIPDSSYETTGTPSWTSGMLPSSGDSAAGSYLRAMSHLEAPTLHGATSR